VRKMISIADVVHTAKPVCHIWEWHTLRPKHSRLSYRSG